MRNVLNEEILNKMITDYHNGINLIELSKIYYNSAAQTGYPSNLKRYMSKLKVLDDSLGELLKILEVFMITLNNLLYKNKKILFF